MADSNDSGSGPMGRVLGPLENKLVLLIASALLGVSGNQILTQLNPDVVRPNPWTSIQAQEAHEHMEDEWKRMFHRHENRIQRSMQETREQMRQLVDSINIHVQAGAHTTADSRLTRLESDMERCERKHD